MHGLLRSVAQASALLALAGSASAASITIESTTALWSAPAGGSAVQLNVTNGDFIDLRWGTPMTPGGNRSGLGFDPAIPPSLTVTDNTTFLLGTLRHYNFPVHSAVSFAELGLGTAIAGADPAVQTFRFRFDIDETPNAQPCPFPSTNPCADRIVVLPLDTGATFLIGGESYTLDLLGFSVDGGQSFVNFFLSEEGQISEAGLYARFTAPPPPVTVSEPVSLSLLAAGLFGVLVFTRRRRYANAQV